MIASTDMATNADDTLLAKINASSVGKLSGASGTRPIAASVSALATEPPRYQRLRVDSTSTSGAHRNLYVCGNTVIAARALTPATEIPRWGARYPSATVTYPAGAPNGRNNTK